MGDHEFEPSESQPVTALEGRFRDAAIVDERSVRASEVLDGELSLGSLETTVHPRQQGDVNDEI